MNIMLDASAKTYVSTEHPLPNRLNNPGVRFVKQASDADVIVFHLPSLYELPETKPAGQLWAVLSIESESQYPIIARPEFMANFDLTITYRRNSDVWIPYVTPETPQRLLKPPKPKTEKAPAAYIASYDWSTNHRNDYVEELMKFIPVDSYGKCLHNRDLPEDAGIRTKLRTIARHRFTLAFENSNCVDYVTEKFFQALEAGSVPVYMGAPNVADFAPANHSYIDVSKFKGPRDLAAFLLDLCANEEKYQRYLEWKRKPLRRSFLNMVECVKRDAITRLVEASRQMLRKKKRTSARSTFPGLPTVVPGVRVSRAADSGFTAYNPLIDRSHDINSTGAFILQLCDGRHSPEDLALQVQKMFQLKSPPLTDVKNWLWYAINDGLIYPLCRS